MLGYEEVAAELGRSVLILSTRGRADARRMVLDLVDRVDGLVLFGRTVNDSVVTEVVASGVPVVLLARPDVPGADTVRADNIASARALASHLVDHGYRRIIFLGDPTSSMDVAQRWDEFSSVLAEAGLRRQLVRCGFGEEDGRAAALAALTIGNSPDAIVCANDEVALGALTAAEELRVSVPEDLAVTGWDDVMAARYARPALTTVRQPSRELGARAARALDELITGARTEHRHQVLPTELIVRVSCGIHNEEEWQ